LPDHIVTQKSCLSKIEHFHLVPHLLGTPPHLASLPIRCVGFPALTQLGYRPTILEGAPPLQSKGGFLRPNATILPILSSLRTSALSAPLRYLFSLFRCAFNSGLLRLPRRRQRHRGLRSEHQERKRFLQVKLHRGLAMAQVADRDILPKVQ